MTESLTRNGRLILDKNWMADMFMASIDSIEEKYRFAAYSTTAHNKYTDTRAGGNWAVNSPPAYCRFADPRQSGLSGDKVKGTAPVGMGGYYSSHLDDNNHLVHYSFGVSTFKGMISFFSSMGDVTAATYARTGRYPIMFLIGKAVGMYTSLRFLPLILVGMVGKFLLNRGSSKYYSFKPTMHSYWKRVDFISNSIAVSTNLYQKPAWADWGAKSEEGALDPTGSSKYGVTQDEYQQLANQAYAAAPEIFRPRGGIDTFKLVNRCQMLATARRKLLEDMANQITSKEDIAKKMLEMDYKMAPKGTMQSMEDMLKEVHERPNALGGVGNPDFDEGESAFRTAIQDKKVSADAMAIEDATQTNQKTSATTNSDGTTKTNVGESNDIESVEAYARINKDPNTGEVRRIQGWFSKLWDQISSDYHGSYQWVTFRVDHTGSTSASFTNSTREAEISSTINAFTSSMAGARFTFSNGATGLPGVDQVIGALTSAVTGFASQFEASGLISLAGSAYVDIPEHWDSSSANFPQETHSATFRGTYANKLSKHIEMYIPTSMLLAGTLPISTGKQQYTSPYLCQVISPGRMSSKLAIISDLNLEIGVGNVGFNRQNQPLAIKATWNTKDTNKVLHSPIDMGGGILNPLGGIFDDDNAFNDFLNTISAVSMADQIVPIRRLSKNLAIKLNQWDSFWSIGNQTMGFYDSMLGRGVKTAVTIAGLTGIKGVTVPQLNTALIN